MDCSHSLTTSLLLDRRCGVAITFALALVPLVPAVDYTQTQQVQTKAQRAADAAALATAKASGDFATRQREGLAILAGQFPPAAGMPDARSIEQVMQNGREVAVRVTVATAVPTTIMNVIGVRTVPIGVDASATRGRIERFDVAFVLDTTGSIAGARLDSLKSATTALVDAFITRRGDSDQIRVSVIPFGQYANVGLGNRNQPWLDVASDHQTP